MPGRLPDDAVRQAMEGTQGAQPRPLEMPGTPFFLWPGPYKHWKARMATPVGREAARKSPSGLIVSP